MGIALLIAIMVASDWVYLLAEAVAAACSARRGFSTLPGFAWAKRGRTARLRREERLGRPSLPWDPPERAANPRKGVPDGELGVLRHLKPGKRAGSFSAFENLEFRVSKMLRDLGRDRENRAVSNHGDSIDFAMMIANEFHMLD